MIRFIILLLFASASITSTAQVWYGTDIYTTNIHGIDANGDSTGFVHIDCLIFPNGDTVCRGIDSASLYALINNKLDSVRKSNDTVYYYRNGMQAFAIIDSDVIPTLLQVDGVIDLKKDYGADSTRTVSISTVTRQAFATGRAIYLGEGDFLIDSTVNVPDSAVIYGEGWKTKIWVANNVKAFSVGNFARIENITFIGTRGSGGTTSQIALSLDTSRGQLIRGCNFYKIAGSAIKITQTNVTTLQGSQIQNCYSDSCYIGIFVANRGEYAGIANCTFINGRYGAYIKGGNTPFDGSKFTGNFYGIYINGNEDGNEAHSSITGATSNHNTHNVYVDSIRFGHLFTGCDFYYGGISVRNSNGVRFNGCDIGFQGSVDTFAVVNSTNTSFDNIAFYNAQEPLRISDGSAFPVSTYSGVTKRYYNLNNDSASVKLDIYGGVQVHTLSDTGVVYADSSGLLKTDLAGFSYRRPYRALAIGGDPYRDAAPFGIDLHQFEVINDSAEGSRGLAQYTSFTNNATYHIRAARGSQRYPKPLLAGDAIMSTGYRGFDGTRFPGSHAAFQVFARENFSLTGGGCYMEFAVSPKGVGDSRKQKLFIYNEKIENVNENDSAIRGTLDRQYSTSAHGSRIVGVKARGTFASPTSIVSGDTLGQWGVMGYEGGNFVRAGGISMRATGTIGTLRVPSEMLFMTATNAAPSVPTVAMVIDNAQTVRVPGFFGTGPTTPTKAFQASGTTVDQSTILIQPTTTTQAGFFVVSNQGGSGYFAADNNLGNQFNNGPYSLNVFTSGNNNIGFSTNGILRVIVGRTGKTTFRDSVSTLQTPAISAEPDTILVKGPGGLVQGWKNPFADGTFTPTLTNVANITSSNAHNCIYSKNDSTITISGKIEFTTTTGGGTLTRLGISLPFASNFTADDDCSGTAFDFNDLEGAVIISDATNDRVELTYHDDTAATHIMRFTCQYRIK